MLQWYNAGTPQITAAEMSQVSDEEDLSQWINIYFLSTFIVRGVTQIYNCAKRDGLLVMSLHWSGWMVTQMWGLDGSDGSTNSFRDGFLFKYCCYSRLFILFAPSEPVQSFQYLTKEAWKLYSGVKHNTLPSQCGHSAIHQLSTISTSHFHHTCRNIHRNKV